MHEDEFQSRVGTVIRDKWTLVRLLGVGGMAAVYVGVHRIGRRDALKVLHAEAAQSKDVCVRFEREAQAVNRFRHRGAVEIRDIDVTEDGAPFLVMELLVGESLGDRSRRLGNMSVAEVMSHAEQVLDVLAAAHQQGIIHRDIKPGNLFLTMEGHIKVLDFGLARIHEGGAVDGLYTKEGTTLGTTPYMSPEQAKGRSIDARADVFAVGATMFRLLTGRYLHVAAGTFDLLMKQATEPAPLIATVDPSLPSSVTMIIDRALAFDRRHRYPSAEAMLEDVRAARAGQAPPNAARLAAEDDRSAVTQASRPPKAAPVSIRASAPSSEVPIYLSGFSDVAELSEDDLIPDTDKDAAPADLETTLVSSGNKPRGK